MNLVYKIAEAIVLATYTVAVVWVVVLTALEDMTTIVP
jgi:hypothetical protein